MISAIAGTAGVGKTALAVHWAHRVRERFGDGQLYVDLHGHAQGSPLSSSQALAQLLGTLGVEADKVPVEVEQAAGLYRSLLADRRMLVVLDNAGSAEQVRPLVPGTPGCLVVVTSRDQLGGLVASHGARRLTLDVLSPDEAVGLLAQIVGQDRVHAEPEAAVALAEVCGRLPLALRIAAAKLTSQPGQPIAGYLGRLRAGDRIAELAVDGDPHAAVRVAFDGSYATLDVDAQRLFRLLGLVPGSEFTPQAAAALAGIPTGQAAAVLERLAGAHLVEPRTPGRFGFHDLLRQYARRRGEREDSEEQRRQAFGRLLDWYLHAADAAAEVLYPDKLRLPVPAAAAGLPAVRFGGHVAALGWLEAERPNLVAAVQHAAAHGPGPLAWLLADTLRGYFWLRRHTVDWLMVARAGLTASTAAGAVRAQAASQLSLGHAHAAGGRYRQAVLHFSDALRLARRAGWTDGQAEALSELGLASWWLSDLQQAAGHHTQALALYRQLGSRQGEAQALGNLGATLHELGRLHHAHQHLALALALLQEVGNRFGQAYILCTLAAVHRDAGRHAQALEAAQVALTLAEEITHRYIQAVAGNTLASIHLCLGHDQEALDGHRQALELARQSATRAAEVGALLGLAAVCQHTGQPQRAIDNAQHARTIAGEAGLRLLEGQAQTTLATAYHALGHHRQALTHAELALGLHRRTGHRLGEARTLRVLGLVLRDTGGAEAAVGCWRQALDLFTDIGSPEADGLRGLLATTQAAT